MQSNVMMQRWQIWCDRFLRFSQDRAPRFVQLLMLNLACGLLVLWTLTQSWPYLVLSLSYAIGAAISVLMEEACRPFQQAIQPTQVTAVLLLIVSLSGLVEFLRYI